MSMVANHSSAAATGKSQSKKVTNTQPPGPASKTSSKTSKSSKNASSTNNNEQASNDSSSGGGIFRPLVVLALPGVNLFRRFSQYKRLPQDPPKDRLEVELERLNNKIDNLLDKLDEVEPEKASNTDEECVVCESNKATMQTFPCAHQVVCRTCFVRTIQTTVAQKKLPLRCVLCRAKILRLKQHHKGSQLHPTREKPTSASSSSAPLSESEVPTQHGGVPQSVSNYSITRLSSSSSNHSFASGVSSVSSGSSVSVRSVRSFNFDTFSNFQNVNLVHKNHLTRTTSGTSFSGRRRSRSPSPVGIGVRSRSMDGRMPKITVDRTPSDESLASSCAQMSMTSPGSSSSPRSPISPPWSSNTAVAAKNQSSNATGAVGAGGVAFFPGNGNGSAHGSPNSPPGNCNGGLNGINPHASSGVNHANNHLTQLTDQNMPMAQPVIQTYQVSERRTSRLCTPLSPIKESRREGSGSSLELRCSPERSMTSSPVTPVDNENTTVATATLIKWDDEEGDLKTVATPVRNQKVTTLKNNGGKQKAHPSSRIRCADKILTQLEIHADAAIANNGTANRKMMASLKSDSTTKRNAIIFGDIADRANANNSHMLTRNASLDESLLDNMKPSHQKPRKSVTFKDC